MSIQTGDTYSYQNTGYRAIKLSDSKIFDPKWLGFEPTEINAGCHNGYWCKYLITEDGIYLDTLYIHCDNENYPYINGHSYDHDYNGNPVECMGCKIYSKLNMKLDYDGNILVGKDIAPGHAKDAKQPCVYRTLKEFSFKNGKFVGETDHSELAKKMREEIYHEKDTDGEPLNIFSLFKRKPKVDAESVENQEIEVKKDYWWLH